jgi:hypothetical protein
VRGLPVGARGQIIGKPFDERTVLSLGQASESAGGSELPAAGARLRARGGQRAQATAARLRRVAASVASMSASERAPRRRRPLTGEGGR